GKLPAETIKDLEAWVKMGAPDPRDKAATVKTASSWTDILRTRRSWWSLQPVQSPAVPKPKTASWSSHAIDHFLLATLEKKGLAPAEPADPRTLIRRLSLVLTGLPPTAEQVEAFVNACGPMSPGQPLRSRAVEQLVDGLIDSPHFGERWAGHW